MNGWTRDELGYWTNPEYPHVIVMWVVNREYGFKRCGEPAQFIPRGKYITDAHKACLWVEGHLEKDAGKQRKAYGKWAKHVDKLNAGEAVT